MYQRDMLAGKTAVITGVSRKIGIGTAVARALAEVGCNVFTTYYRPYDAAMPWGSQADEAESVIAELRQMGVRAEGLELDLSDPAAPGVLFTAVEAAIGPADILVNNATYSVSDGVAGLTAVHIDYHYAVNVRGMMLLCAEFVRRFQGEWGRIINLSSGQGVGPMPTELAYAATKGAVDAFTVSLATAVAGQYITVNAVDPGGTDTGWMPPDLYAHVLAHAPMGRVGQPEDAARLIRFLASPEAGWITGQIIRSRGGS
ncbi:MAG: SDR family oxidoreductase [Anaerolineae bacterium]|nr:SDR family oxidoreductase [Anaerolineae bacterium]